MRCSKCGKQITAAYCNMCYRCYMYYHNGGTDNPLPPIGTVARDYRGYVICHKCGRAYTRLGSHIKESHSMTIAEYKAEFGLCDNAKTTEASYSNHMSELAYKHDMPKMLNIVGKGTRIRPGESDKRLGKKVRLQECIERSARYKKQNKV